MTVAATGDDSRTVSAAAPDGSAATKRPPRRMKQRPRSEPSPRIEFAEICLLIAIGLGTAVMPLLVEDTDVQHDVLRVVAVVVLSFIPGWLYVRFSGYRAAAVWEEYVLHLHRLGIDEPANLPEPLHSSTYHEEWTNDRAACGRLGPVEENIYLQKFEAYYGKVLSITDQSVGFRTRVDALLPALVATAVIATGWAAVLHSGQILNASEPLSDALRFGFMGAYSFVLQMLVRRFFQSDLRPSAYISSIVRIVTVLVLVAVLHQLAMRDLGAGTEATIAFMVGFFPLVGMQALQRLVSRVLKSSVKSLDVPYPLSDLDGLNIWNEARLLEEGIEDMQNLTTANLVDMMLHTRVPVGRLVDWVDQAYLYLHLPPVPTGRQVKKGNVPVPTERDELRCLGIRTATDLEDAFRPSDDDDDEDPRGSIRVPRDDNRALIEALRWVLNRNDPDHTKPSVTQAMLKTFEAEPNLDHVRHWKRSWRRRYGCSGDGPAAAPLVGAAN